MQKKIQGALGEALAREFLEHQGYQFITANFVRRVGEIDLIMRSPEDQQGQSTIVFVEVRYRAPSRFGGALASIDWRKQRKMLRVANAWLQHNASHDDCARIEVIALEPVGDTLESSETIWKNHRLLWLENAVEEAT